MKKISKTETWVGLFLIVGIALATFAVLSVSNFKTSKDATYPINIVFMDAAGLIKGSQIRLGGAFVGEVTSAPELTEEGNSVILEGRIRNDVKIQAGSQFSIAMQNLLGDKYIDIVPPEEPSNHFIPPHGVVIGQSESDLSKLKNNAVQASEEIVVLLRKLDGHTDHLDQAIKDISAAAQGLAETTNRLNNGILSEENVQKFSSILANVNQTTSKLPQLADQSSAAISELQTTLGDIRGGVNDVRGKLDKLDPALNEVAPTLVAFRQSADNLSQMSTDIRKGQGSLGLMIYDKNFRKEIEQFVRNLRSYGILRYRNPDEQPETADPRAGYSGSRR
jgi:phospholipid/cholesterol/gamma-HCH transport system substrate-binding protein